jgi:hypothetical protein
MPITKAALAMFSSLVLVSPASAEVYGFKVKEFGQGLFTVKLTTSGTADRTVLLRGKCTGAEPPQTIKITEYGTANETWKVVENGSAPMSICITGDVDAFLRMIRPGSDLN